VDDDQPIRKRCRVCGDDKPLEQFPLQRLGRLGRHPLCKPCRAAQERLRYARNRAAILERARNDERRKRRVRWRALARKYGLDEHDHAALVVAQRGCCAICERRDTRLVVDHDHRTGQVRGLLCVTCNFALGEMDDDPTRCHRAASYLAARR
jgi:Recombination endonuclease VII